MERAKNSLRVLSFNLLDIDDIQVFKDQGKLKIIHDLREDLVILRPDKGNGVVLVNITDYNASLCHLFSDRPKFKTFSTDLTPTRLRSLHSFLHRLLKRGELNDEIYRQSRPQNAHIARAHGLPKIHKLPKFRPTCYTIL